jgi:hypothetical protein
MKKTILFFVAFAAQMNFAQNVFPLPSGNVGIGTITPAYTLDVNGATRILSTVLTGSNSPFPNSTVMFSQAGFNNIFGVDGSWTSKYFGMKTNGDFIIIGGNIGIGTTTPSAKLEVYNTAAAGHLILSANDNLNADKTRIDIDFKVANQNHTVGRISSAYITSVNGGSGSLRFFTRDNGALNEKMTISSNGYVGIGTVSPVNKLDVNGTIHSKEVKVDMSGWSDFVFKKEYNLPTLEEVEKHIAEKGHLENIPSEEEVLKNGINLGDMNAKLLQKMEEMTLYMIEQNKRMNQLEKENQNLKIKIDSITK